MRTYDRTAHADRIMREIGFNPDCVGDCLDDDACTCEPQPDHDEPA